QRLDLLEIKPCHLPNRIRERRAVVRHEISQALDVHGAGRRDDAMSGEMRAQRIDGLRPPGLLRDPGCLFRPAFPG
ncbi:hypothetical protein, partial [Rhodosalinus sediminis]|uniref:hypothetical protein n=1 Tax=Rhodosalinus sediminis TaxID=1940533 RepID=UPI002357ED5C